METEKQPSDMQHDSREESSELRDELHLPAAGEVDHLSAALDVAANTRTLHLAHTAGLKARGYHICMQGATTVAS